MPATAYFSPEVFTFLRQLKRHNDREWFAKNKARYQACVVEPALLFIGAFAPHLYEISSFFVADARPGRGSLFRIYRDTASRSTSVHSKHTLVFISLMPAARMLTPPCFIYTSNRPIALPQRVFGIPRIGR
jgi:uncharacterized protein (DUF2461 family)